MWQNHTYHVHFSFSVGSSGHHSYLMPLAGFGAGAALFASGFWKFRSLRIIENTPRIAIRAVPMGLVHVHGKAAGSQLLTSPVTGTPCYYYKVRLDRWRESGKNRGWYAIKTRTEGRLFYLDDGTGKVQINAQAAEYDLPFTYWAEFGPRTKGGSYLDPSLGLAAPSEEQARTYAAQNDPSFTVAEKTLAQLDQKYAESSGFAQKILERQKQAFAAQNPLTGNGSYRITEHCLVAGHEYDIIGTCVQNPQPQDDYDRNLIVKGHNEKTFVISGFSEIRLEKILRRKALGRIAIGAFLMVITMGVIIFELMSH